MVGRGGNSRNWLSPLFMLIHYSMAKYDNIPGCPGYYISKRGQIYSRVINTNKSDINLKNYGKEENKSTISE